MKFTLNQRLWDFFVCVFFNNMCNRKLLVHSRIFVGLVKKAADVLLCQVNLLNYLFGKTS